MSVSEDWRIMVSDKVMMILQRIEMTQYRLKLHAKDGHIIDTIAVIEQFDDWCHTFIFFSSVFCDFCKQLKSQSAHVVVNRNKQEHKTIVDDQQPNPADCHCEVMEPGLYDIETEMCTPELDDAKDYIPAEIQNDILEKRPVIIDSFS